MRRFFEKLQQNDKVFISLKKDRKIEYKARENDPRTAANVLGRARKASTGT